MTLLMMATVAFFARRNGWGSDTPFSWTQLGEAALEVVIVMAFPLAVWLMMKAGLSDQRSRSASRSSSSWRSTGTSTSRP